MKNTIGIDIGGTNTRLALVDETYRIIDKIIFLTDTTSPEPVINRLAAQINAMKQTADIAGIGLSCPGPLDHKAQKILFTYNLSEKWHGYPLCQTLEELTGLPVILENDANCAALAEAVIGAGKGAGVVLYLTVSTGIGCGIIINGKIYSGSHGFAGEVAHVRLGESSGIESISSGTAITQQAKALGLCVEHAGDVYRLSEKGITQAEQIIKNAEHRLAQFIAAAYAFLDPDVVIVGGSVALKTPDYTERITESLHTLLPKWQRDTLSVRLAQAGDDSGLIGTAILARKRFVYNQEFI